MVLFVKKNALLFLVAVLNILAGCVQTIPSIHSSAPIAQQTVLGTILKIEQDSNKSDKAKIVSLPSKAKTSSAVLNTESITSPTKITTPLTHKQFFELIGKRKLPTLVGTSLQLNLKIGAISGTEGYLDDMQDLILYSCPTLAHIFNGGRLLAKVAKIRSNDNGVFVTLDRCDK